MDKEVEEMEVEMRELERRTQDAGFLLRQITNTALSMMPPLRWEERRGERRKPLKEKYPNPWYVRHHCGTPALMLRDKTNRRTLACCINCWVVFEPREPKPWSRKWLKGNLIHLY